MQGPYERPIVRAVADTHALIWWLYADPRLSTVAYTFMEESDAGSDQIAVSSMTLVEVVYLVEKGRIPAGTFDGILTEFNHPYPTFVEVPVDHHIAEALNRIERAQVPDMPDRIIAATAVFLEVPLISRDGKIRLSNVRTIW